MNETMLDILIGKHIDSEITPAEQRLLDHELKTNHEVKLLLEQYQQLDQLSRQAVDKELDRCGQSFEAIFGKAKEQYQPKSRLRRLVFQSRLRIPMSIAAGFLVGLFSLHVYTQLYRRPMGVVSKPSPPIVASVNQRTEPDESVAAQMNYQTHSPRSRQSRMDWYTFTDPSGARWLLETQRQSDYDLASYTGDL